MSWVKLDDGFPDHPKIAPISDRAFRIHVRALCYCGRHLTDGFVPKAIVDDITRGKQAVVNELLAAGLWHANGGSGYAINDFLDYNPSKADVESERQKKRDAAKKAAEARWNR